MLWLSLHVIVSTLEMNKIILEYTLISESFVLYVAWSNSLQWTINFMFYSTKWTSFCKDCTIILQRYKYWHSEKISLNSSLQKKNVFSWYVFWNWVSINEFPCFCFTLNTCWQFNCCPPCASWLRAVYIVYVLCTCNWKYGLKKFKQYNTSFSSRFLFLISQ